MKQHDYNMPRSHYGGTMIQESGEMYLETILLLSRKKKDLHAVDISDEMNFSKPSISRALGRLKSEGYITINDENHISLTEKGRQVAENIYEKHEVISKLLMSLGIDEETATTDACKIEHVISDKTFAAIKAKCKL